MALLDRSTVALAFPTLATCLALYLFVSVPLTMLGGYLAKCTTVCNPPMRLEASSREIPDTVSWKKCLLVQPLAALCLPFGSLHLQMNSVFDSMWSHRLYVFDGSLVMLVLLLLLLVCLQSLHWLRFQLARKAHPAWTETFGTAGMPSVVLLAYGLYFCKSKGNTLGWLQLSFYFGYTAIVALACFLMLAALGFSAAGCT
jgi:hypothetical protein